MPHAKHNCNIVLQVISCMLHKLSFRRFTYGNLVTTFTSSKHYSLVVFPKTRQGDPPGSQSEDLTKMFNR